MNDKELGKKHLVNLDGIRFHITGDPTSEEARRRIHAARLDVKQLNVTHPVPISRLERPGKYEIRTTHGRHEVTMTIPEVPVPPVIERRPIEQEFPMVRYVPAFDVWGYKDGTWGQVGYAICSNGWDGPYEFLETENVITPYPEGQFQSYPTGMWWTRELVAAHREENPRSTVDPFLWPAWKGYYRNWRPSRQSAMKPFDGVLKTKTIEVGLNTKGRQRQITEMVSTFEDIFYYPYHDEDGSWRENTPVETETLEMGGPGAIVKDYYTYVKCSDGWRYSPTISTLVNRWFSCYRHFNDDRGLFCVINNIEVPSTRQAPNFLLYDWPTKAQGPNCGWSSWYEHKSPPWDEWLSNLVCTMLLWFESTTGCYDCSTCWDGCTIRCACNNEVNRGLTFKSLSEDNIPSKNRTPSTGDGPETWAPSYRTRLYERCIKNWTNNNHNTHYFSSNCQDLQEHIFWYMKRPQTFRATYDWTQYVPVNGTPIGWGPGCSSGDVITSWTTEKVHNDEDYEDQHCVINNEWFPWFENRPADWIYYPSGWRDSYLEQIHSRYFKFNEDEFWCLVTAWNYDYTYDVNDDGNYNPEGTLETADPNRKLFMIYRSSDPGRFDMRPGEDSQCVAFDIVTPKTSGLFAIPGLTDPDGGPLLSYGHFRLFRIMEETGLKEHVRYEEVV